MIDEIKASAPAPNIPMRFWYPGEIELRNEQYNREVWHYCWPGRVT